MNIAICDDEKAIREQINEMVIKEKPGVCPELYETGDGLLAAGRQYFIETENSFDGTALARKDSGLPISTKEDQEVHGIGLKNIRKCAVKYGGDMDCIVKGSRFILSVMVKN